MEWLVGAGVCAGLHRAVRQSGRREGPEMPAIGFGTFNNFEDPAAVGAAVQVAWEHGYRHLDCAELYSNEEQIGRTVRLLPRSSCYLVSKLWNHHHRPDQIRAALRGSLSKLGVGYLDCYLIHWPVAWLPQPEMLDGQGKVIVGSPDGSDSLADTWAAMEALVDSGLVRHIGVSNFGLTKLKELLALGPRIRPYCNQLELHPYLAQPALVRFCEQQGIKPVAYHPIGKPSRREPENNVLLDPVVEKISSSLGKTAAQVVLKWNLQRGVAVIPKSCTESRIKENFALNDFELSAEAMEEINALDRNQRFCNPSWMNITWE